MMSQHNDSPIGRNHWRMDKHSRRIFTNICPKMSSSLDETSHDHVHEIDQIQLTFSTCKYGQFTCDDGQCLDSVA